MAARILGVPADLAGGLVLAAAAVAGILGRNLDATAAAYLDLLALTTTAGIGTAAISKPLQLWINDGLMAIFFLVVAIEIKREIVLGALSQWRKAALPVYSAAGGMAVPALVFLGIVGFDAAEARGWAIPSATDIAFAVGVLSLFGSRVPPPLKTFLLALAVVDDLGAIVIIAFFYTEGLATGALGIAALVLVLLLALNLGGVRRTWPYVLLGLVLWVAVLKSGVHATLSGVALGLLVPLGAERDGRSLGEDWEHGLHSWSTFLVMPVFAFANAGVDLGGLSFAALLEPVPLGIAAGLFVGKQIGVFGTAWASVRLGAAELGPGIGWGQLYGTALLAGIGFTMSLFIGSLAFPDPALQDGVRLGVIAGSLVSGLCGALVLSLVPRAATPPVTAGSAG